MDGDGFDRLIRTLLPRRTVGGILLASVATLAAAHAAKAKPRPACFVTGERCDPGGPGSCCSGVCKKRKGKHKCVPAGEAFGCTADPAQDVCRSNANPTPCPIKPEGFCVAVSKKKALCISNLFCVECQSDADCVVTVGATFGALTMRCITQCPGCEASTTTACVWPAS